MDCKFKKKKEKKKIKNKTHTTDREVLPKNSNQTIRNLSSYNLWTKNIFSILK